MGKFVASNMQNFQIELQVPVDVNLSIPIKKYDTTNADNQL